MPQRSKNPRNRARVGGGRRLRRVLHRRPKAKGRTPIQLKELQSRDSRLTHWAWRRQHIVVFAVGFSVAASLCCLGRFVEGAGLPRDTSCAMILGFAAMGVAAARRFAPTSQRLGHGEFSLDEPRVWARAASAFLRFARSVELRNLQSGTASDRRGDGDSGLIGFSIAWRYAVVFSCLFGLGGLLAATAPAQWSLTGMMLDETQEHFLLPDIAASIIFHARSAAALGPSTVILCAAAMVSCFDSVRRSVGPAVLFGGLLAGAGLGAAFAESLHGCSTSVACAVSAMGPMVVGITASLQIRNWEPDRRREFEAIPLASSDDCPRSLRACVWASGFCSIVMGVQLHQGAGGGLALGSALLAAGVLYHFMFLRISATPCPALRVGRAAMRCGVLVLAAGIVNPWLPMSAPRYEVGLALVASLCVMSLGLAALEQRVVEAFRATCSALTVVLLSVCVWLAVLGLAWGESSPSLALLVAGVLLIGASISVWLGIGSVTKFRKLNIAVLRSSFRWRVKHL